MNMTTDLKAERIAQILKNPRHAELFKTEPTTGIALYEADIIKPEIKRDRRLISGMLTTPDVDEEGDVILPEGIDTSYFPEKVKAQYWNHDYSAIPVGVVRRFQKRAGGLWTQIEVRDSAFGNELLAAIEMGAVAHQSIGLRVIESGAPTDDEEFEHPGCERMVRRSKAIEGSFVAMPCNGMATLDPVTADVLDRMLKRNMITMSSAIIMGFKPGPMKVRSQAKRILSIDTKSGVAFIRRAAYDWSQGTA